MSPITLLPDAFERYHSSAMKPLLLAALIAVTASCAISPQETETAARAAASEHASRLLQLIDGGWPVDHQLDGYISWTRQQQVPEGVPVEGCWRLVHWQHSGEYEWKRIWEIASSDSYLTAFREGVDALGPFSLDTFAEGIQEMQSMAVSPGCFRKLADEIRNYRNRQKPLAQAQPSPDESEVNKPEPVPDSTAQATPTKPHDSVPSSCWTPVDPEQCAKDVDSRVAACRGQVDALKPKKVDQETWGAFFAKASCRVLVEGIVRGCENPTDTYLCSPEIANTTAKLASEGTMLVMRHMERESYADYFADRIFVGLNWVGALVGAESETYISIRSQFEESKAFAGWANAQKYKRASGTVPSFNWTAARYTLYEGGGREDGAMPSTEDEIRRIDEDYDECYNGCRLIGDPTSYSTTSCMSDCSDRRKQRLERVRAGGSSLLFP